MQKNKQVKFQSSEILQKTYKTLESELEGFWSQDIWNPHENPFGTIKREYDGKRTFYGRYIHFDQINSVPLKTELKYALYQKMVKKEWTVATLHSGGTNFICRIIKWLVETSPIDQSFLDKSLEKWLISLRTWLVENGLSKQRDYVRYTKDQQAISSKREDDTVGLFKNIYQTLEIAYDKLFFFDRDVWNCPHKSGTIKGRIYFNDFQQNWLKSWQKFI